MDGWQVTTLVGGAFLTGAAVPIFVFHYQRFWDTCRSGSELARRVHRGLQDVRGSLEGFGLAATFCGRPGLYRKISETSARTKAVLAFGDSLFDLRDEVLEKDVDRTIRNVRSFLAYGLTELMGETGNADDFKVPGTPAHKARQAYLDSVKSVYLPEIDRLLKRTRPLTSPWGFWWRSFTTILGRLRAFAKGPEPRVETPPPPSRPHRRSRRIRRRRTSTGTSLQPQP